MGFVARTIFWLGLVYSAMPLDFGSLVSETPAGALTRCARGPSDDCRKRIEDLRKTVEAAAALGLIDRVAGAGAASPARDPDPPRKAPQGASE